MKKMKIQIMLAAIMTAMIGFAGCSTPDVDPPPCCPLDIIEIRNVPFTTAIGSPYNATEDSIGFLTITAGARSGFGVARGHFPNGASGPAIGPRVAPNTELLPNDETRFTVTTYLYNLHTPNVTLFMPIQFFQDVQSEDTDVDPREFEEDLERRRGTTYVRPSGSVNINYVTICAQLNPVEMPNMGFVPPLSRGSWTVDFLNAREIDPDGRYRLILYWDDMQ